MTDLITDFISKTFQRFIDSVKTEAEESKNVLTQTLAETAQTFLTGQKKTLESKEMNEITRNFFRALLDKGTSMVEQKMTGGKVDSLIGNLLKVGNQTVVLTEDTDHPYQLNAAIVSAVNSITAGCTANREKAKHVFDWFEREISYGQAQRGKKGYRTSTEVFQSHEGVCGEMAVLYVAMVRAAGVPAKFCAVSVDESGKSVQHACASLTSEHILVDPAYHHFDIKHKKYKIMSDHETLEHFKALRNN